MKAIIKPFIDATVETFDTMMDVKAEIKESNLQAPTIDAVDFCAYIGLSGDAQGMVALTFDSSVATGLYEKFVGESAGEVNDDVRDSLGEIVNILAGAAKANIAGHDLSISLPTVMQGEKFSVSLPKDAPVMYVILALDGVGETKLIVSLKMNS